MKVGAWGTLLALAAWGQSDAPPSVKAVQDPGGQVDVTEAGRPVLRYNHKTVPPPEGYLEKVSAGNRKYAVPRSDYIHPLHGLDGEILTHDWSADHPHHRGIYWAWPEVDWGNRRGDLHALQHVFARPIGQVRLSHGKGCARIEAENRWEWEDGTPIVRERATIEIHPSGAHGRYVDLRFEFTALADGVRLARRGTKHYGGLNLRLSAWKDVRLDRFADPAGAEPRKAWSSVTSATASLAVLEKATNPDYPGDWITYKELPWFQPAFPAAGTRYELSKERPLVLEYRLWIRRVAPTNEEGAAAWMGYNR
jgi:hypothetical protein